MKIRWLGFGRYASRTCLALESGGGVGQGDVAADDGSRETFGVPSTSVIG